MTGRARLQRDIRLAARLQHPLYGTAWLGQAAPTPRDRYFT
jgi:hypothetical protein